jgi:hypothetical protein
MSLKQFQQRKAHNLARVGISKNVLGKYPHVFKIYHRHRTTYHRIFAHNCITKCNLGDHYHIQLNQIPSRQQTMPGKRKLMAAQQKLEDIRRKQERENEDAERSRG